MEVIFRRVHSSAKSVKDTIDMLQSVNNSRIISSSGSNVLAHIDEATVPWLQQQLPGWVVSPQSIRAPIPDARIKLGSGVS